MKIIFWENIISQHKVPYWNYLTKSNKISQFILVVEESLSDNLIKQGWENELEVGSKLDLIIHPSDAQILEILKNNIADSYHIFSGIRAIPMVFTAFKMSWAFPIHRILLTESVNLNGKRGFTRRLAALFIERKYLNHYDIVLGSGYNTKAWYLECGLKPLHFYPFMYAIESDDLKKTQIPTEPYKMIFIGQLIKRKGLDILLKSLATLKNLHFTLDIYGAGEMKLVFKTLSQSLGLENKVNFKGVVNNHLLKSKMNDYHCLVLPSRFDGWGAVVNEAIAAGIKVICSDRSGAAILLVKPSIGRVFPSLNHKALAKILRQEIIDVEQMDSGAILDYAAYLQGKKVSGYLIEILEHHYKKIGIRPIPPWEKYFIDQIK